MSDIVERLRVVMRDQFYQNPRVSRVCEGAIKEIELLRGELEALKHDIDRHLEMLSEPRP